MSRLRHSQTLCVAIAALVLAGCATSRAQTDATAAASAEAPATDALSRFNKPAQGILTGGRITADDLPALGAAGIRHVIDLTPDAEIPDFDEASAVRAAGLAYDNCPSQAPPISTVPPSTPSISCSSALKGLRSSTAPAATASAPWRHCAPPG